MRRMSFLALPILAIATVIACGSASDKKKAPAPAPEPKKAETPAPAPKKAEKKPVDPAPAPAPKPVDPNQAPIPQNQPNDQNKIYRQCTGPDAASCQTYNYGQGYPNYPDNGAQGGFPPGQNGNCFPGLPCGGNMGGIGGGCLPGLPCGGMGGGSAPMGPPGTTTCIGRDAGYEEHYGAHPMTGIDPIFVQESAFHECTRLHGTCLLTCFVN